MTASAATAEGDRIGVLAPSVGVAAVVTFLFAVVLLDWTGYTESDDSLYAGAAWGWVQHPPLLGDSHWSLRHCIVLPMALLFRVFGRSEVTLEMPSLLYWAALLLLTFFCARQVGGWGAGLLAAVLLGAAPTVASASSVVVDDVPEACFVVASLWTFHAAVRTPRAALFVASGMLAGMGFVTRETSSALVIGYGILFLLNYGGSRLAYVWMALGFVLTAGLDTAMLWAASGDPLYRLHISMHGVRADNPNMGGQFTASPGLDRFGDVAAPRWLQAPLVLFVGQHFGLLFWAALPAAITVAMRAEYLQSRRVVRLFAALAAVWFLVLSYAYTFLWILPRYQIVPAALLALPLGLALSRLGTNGYRIVSAGVVVVILGTDVGLIALTNRNPLWAERTLVSYVSGHPGTVLTDPGTLRGARWLLEIRGLTGRVRAAVPEAGSLYFFDAAPRRGIPGDWPIHAPAANWVEQARYAAPAAAGRMLIHALDLRRVLPGTVTRKLDREPPTAALYLVPQGG